MNTKWWNQTVFYQIYMPSFADGNGDGIGDFKGITEKLPYLKELGIGGIWLTPFYPSPMVDNGYDVSDYCGIRKEYGTMEEFEAFLAKAHELGIRVIADVVFNHSSNKHPWFKEKPEYYIWKKEIPNNWESFFGGSAWEWDEERQAYYYHSFAKEQVDLNWANPDVEKEIQNIMKFWLEKGIDGFRMDVINNLTISDEFPDNPTLPDGSQDHVYDVNQQGVKEIFTRIRRFTEQYGDIFLVGEISSDDLSVIHSYTGKDGLITTFNFNLGSRNSFDVEEVTKELQAMNELYTGEERPTLFWGSHDMARFPSRFGFSDDSLRLAAMFLCTFRGVPFIYFGEEIGMRNRPYRTIEDVVDIQGRMAYELAKAAGKSDEEAMTAARKNGRDYSRGFMQWNDGENAGFTTGTPWITLTAPVGEYQVEAQRGLAGSTFSFYQALLELRKQDSCLQLGDCFNIQNNNNVLSYERRLGEEERMILLNFSDKEISLEPQKQEGWQAVFATERVEKGKLVLPGESGILLTRCRKQGK